MKIQRISILSALILIVGVFACTEINNEPIAKTLELPAVPFDYQFDDNNADFFGRNDPADNPLTNEGATLGRVLFYDGALSRNNTVSCASCHKQQIAFADNKAESIGFEGLRTSRNSPPIMNLAFANRFFWDFSVDNLEQQVIMPVQNHIEMGIEDIDYLADKLSAIDYYPQLFNDAFGDSEVTPDRISKALAQFIRSIGSNNSKFDEARMDGFASLTEIERHGMNVFERSGCNNCHSVLSGTQFGIANNGELIFIDINIGGGYAGTGQDLANIGLDMDYADEGAGNGQFKVPTLRNIAVTFPYMHDGRFHSLEEVIEHYNSGVEPHEHLDFRLRENFTSSSPKRLNLTEYDKLALVSFLNTLTDEEVLKDEKFSNPFVY